MGIIFFRKKLLVIVYTGGVIVVNVFFESANSSAEYRLNRLVSKRMGTVARGVGEFTIYKKFMSSFF
jgi:hypothetical protein